MGYGGLCSTADSSAVRHVLLRSVADVDKGREGKRGNPMKRRDMIMHESKGNDRVELQLGYEF